MREGLEATLRPGFIGREGHPAQKPYSFIFNSIVKIKINNLNCQS